MFSSLELKMTALLENTLFPYEIKAVNLTLALIMRTGWTFHL